MCELVFLPFQPRHSRPSLNDSLCELNTFNIVYKITHISHELQHKRADGNEMHMHRGCCTADTNLLYNDKIWISLNLSYFNTLGSRTHIALGYGGFKHINLIYIVHSAEQHEST